jgi:hypothetical protein
VYSMFSGVTVWHCENFDISLVLSCTGMSLRELVCMWIGLLSRARNDLRSQCAHEISNIIIQSLFAHRAAVVHIFFLILNS